MRKITRFALSYIEKHISFYPLDHGSKLPLLVEDGTTRYRIKWSEYRKRLPTKQEAEYWFEYLKATDLAIVTGSFSRIVVVDCDDTKSAVEFAKICYTEEGIDVGGVLRVLTRRGVHYWFRVPETVESIPSVSCLVDGYSIELKGDGSSAKSPPSYFESFSGKYEFIKGKLIDVPKWVLDKSQSRVVKPVAQPEQLPEKWLHNGHRVPEIEFQLQQQNRKRKGININKKAEYILQDAIEMSFESRNKACFVMCLRMLRLGLPETTIQQYISSFISQCQNKDHPFTEQEAMRCFDSAKRYI